MEHFETVGSNLETTVKNYNKVVGSLESKFLPQARKINQLAQGYVKKEMPDVAPLESNVRIGH